MTVATSAVQLADDLHTADWCLFVGCVSPVASLYRFSIKVGSDYKIGDPFSFAQPRHCLGLTTRI